MLTLLKRLLYNISIYRVKYGRGESLRDHRTSGEGHQEFGF